MDRPMDRWIDGSIGRWIDGSTGRWIDCPTRPDPTSCFAKLVKKLRVVEGGKRKTTTSNRYQRSGELEPKLTDDQSILVRYLFGLSRLTYL